MQKKHEGDTQVFEQDLPMETVLTLPENLTEHFILGKYLIISALTANWLVFSEKVEYSIFCLIRQRKSIGEIAKILMLATEEKVADVVAQILAKDFLANAKIFDKKNFQTTTIHLTNGCNLRCKTCYLKATVASKDECSASMWKKYLTNFKKSGGKIVTVTGGEVMTRKDFLEILCFAKSLKLKVVLLTNGTLITKINAQTICRICDEVQLSIDGPDEKSHDSIRGKGTFVRVMSALAMLSKYSRKYKCRIAIAMTPTPETLSAFKSHLGKFVKMVQKTINNDVFFRITPLLLEGRNIGCMSFIEQDNFRKEVIKICDKHLVKGWFDMLDTGAIVPNHKLCGCGLAESLSASANGEIKACDFIPTLVGTISDEISLTTKKLNEISNPMRVENIYPCKNCDLRYFCGGKCRVNLKMLPEGSITIPCDVAFRNQWYEKLVRINHYLFETNNQ